MCQGAEPRAVSRRCFQELCHKALSINCAQGTVPKTYARSYAKELGQEAVPRAVRKSYA
jgi:hypothetical protein